MDLFPPSPHDNLLPCDGTVNYLGKVLSQAGADAFFDALLQGVPWRHDEAIIFGKHITTARRVAWYGDSGFSYTYSGTTKQAVPWNEELLKLKTLVEHRCKTRFNSCLLNLYGNGTEGMAWHSDDEKELGPNTTIASLSLGAERRFCFKHKLTGQLVEIVLEHGSLLVMKEATQTHWQHSLPKARKVSGPRINLTFRTIVGSSGGA